MPRLVPFLSMAIVCSGVALAAAKPQLAPYQTIEATITEVNVLPPNNVKGQVSVIVKFNKAVPNAGTDFNFTVKGVAVQGQLHAHNVEMVPDGAGGKDERLRILGEPKHTLALQWMPSIRGYTANDLKGVKIKFQSYQYKLKVTDVEELKKESPYIDSYERMVAEKKKAIAANKKALKNPELNEEEKAALVKKGEKLEIDLAETVEELANFKLTKFYKLTFDHNYVSGQSQLVTEEKGKPAYLSIKTPFPFVTDHSEVEVSPKDPRQVSNPKDLLNKEVTIYSYDSYWDTSWGAGFGKE